MNTPDNLVSLVVQILTIGANRPAGLSILDHESLPLGKDELPATCVYLTEDRPADERYVDGPQWREAVINVEIRAAGPVLSGTKPLRDWVIPLVLGLELPNITIGLTGFHPFGEMLDFQMAGAVLEFTFRYLWSNP